MKIRLLAFGVMFACSFLFVGCQAPSELPTSTPASAPTTRPTRTTEPTRQPSSSPSAQPSATQEPPTVTSTPVPLTVTAKQNVNVRSGPGTNFSVVGKLQQGESAPLKGKSSDGTWWQIAFPTEQERSWVAAQFTTVSDTTVSVAVVQVPTLDTSATPRATAAPQATVTPISVELIAFQSKMDSPTFDLYTIKPDGTELRRLTDASGNDQFPSWSPDAKRIVFSSDRDGQNEIYVMNADGSNQQRLAPHSEEDLMPRWSHDGKLIAFFSTRDGKSIFVMNPDGSNVRKVIANENITFEYEQFRLAWSPNDQRLGYTAGDPTDPNDYLYLYIINLDGTVVQRNFDLSAPEWMWFESFSPDGRYQLVQYYGNRPKEIFIADAHTKANQRRLADGGNGVWSPR
ncbi:hypothetical protein FBQ82_00545 [Anaerolineae bacterium CFX7]|nr:hypothetical protein [Anaerolineae bacterium CFX7]